MTPEQAAEAQLHLASMQLWITGLALFFGPLLGVIFTFWFQSRKEKIEAKRNLFLTLMADRKGLTVSYKQSEALNTIDVVFYDNKKIKDLWHKYYVLLAQPPGEERVHTWLELLEEMSKDLHYPKLTQIDLDKFYVPKGHVDELKMKLQTEIHLLRVLKNTESFLVDPLDEDEN